MKASTPRIGKYAPQIAMPNMTPMDRIRKGKKSTPKRQSSVKSPGKSPAKSPSKSPARSQAKSPARAHTPQAKGAKRSLEKALDSQTSPVAKKRRKSTVSKKQRRSLESKPRKFKSGYRALKEIKIYQRTTGFLIPRKPFGQLVREIIHSVTRDGTYRIQSLALEGLQEACEYYLVRLFEDAMVATVHRNRVTLGDKDMLLVNRLRQP